MSASAGMPSLSDRCPFRAAPSEASQDFRARARQGSKKRQKRVMLGSRDSLVTNGHWLARKLELWSFVTREFCRRQKLRSLELFGQPRSHLHSPQLLSTPQASDQAVLAAGGFPTCRGVRHADVSLRTASPTPATVSQSPLARLALASKLASAVNLNSKRRSVGCWDGD